MAGSFKPTRMGLWVAQNRAVRMLLTDSATNRNVIEYRSKELKDIENQLNGNQFNKKMDWFEAEKYRGSQFVGIQDRKPYLRYDLLKIHIQRIISKLYGHGRFPKFKVEDRPEAEESILELITKAQLQTQLIRISYDLFAMGSAFLRVRVMDGQLIFNQYSPNQCWPQMDRVGDLESIIIMFVYKDEFDLNPNTGEPQKKWHCVALGRDKDIQFDSPDYEPGKPPEFEILDEAEHNLGFVQGHWFVSGDVGMGVDGPSLVESIIGIGESITYNLCQSDRATEYGADPQTVFSGMGPEDLDVLAKSKDKAWSLGREGSAQFLEISGAGLAQSEQTEMRLQRKAQEATRAIEHEPEKIVGSAQSGRAMEILYGPLVDLVEELRPVVGDQMKKFVKTMALLIERFPVRNIQVQELTEEDIDKISLQWGKIFPPTLNDISMATSSLSSAIQSGLLSKETAIAKLAPYYDIEDVAEEIDKISKQPVDNPYLQG